MIKELTDLFKAFCEARNCPDWLTNEILFYLAAIGFAVFLLNQFWQITKQAIRWRNQRILNRDLAPYYSKADVYRATRYYIPTYFQNVAPSEDDEPSRKYIAAAKSRLIPLFLKKAFNNDKDDNKFYLVLADSGMGKTTFLINLYIAYKNRWRNPFKPALYDIKLLPLGFPNILKDIEKIENKKDTILLLDALDEDIEAVKDYVTRLNLILSKIYHFREVVITCRTQFFPSEKEEPSRTGYITGGESGEYRFQKLYLSVFDNKDIRRYLRKRFNIFQRKKYKRALQIAEKSPNLVVRPMILSQIEDLVGSDREFEFSFEIYEEFIERWIQREARKPDMIKKYGSEAKFKKLLYEFSQQFAVNLYENKQERGGYFLKKGERFSFKDIEIEDLKNQIVKDDKHELTENEKRSKSLLNRNAAGEYKFSHKSIFEYFLVLELLRNYEFCKQFDFNGMDAAKHFYGEIVIKNLRISDGYFSTTSSRNKFHPNRLLSHRMINDVFILKQNYDVLNYILIDFVFENLRILTLSDNILNIIYIDIYMCKYLKRQSDTSIVVNNLVTKFELSNLRSQIISINDLELIEMSLLLNRIGVMETVNKILTKRVVIGTTSKEIRIGSGDLRDISNVDEKTMDVLQMVVANVIGRIDKFDLMILELQIKKVNELKMLAYRKYSIQC
jgi:hypothetical protein